MITYLLINKSESYSNIHPSSPTLLSALAKIDARNDVIANKWNEEVASTIGDRTNVSRTSRMAMTPPSSLTRKRPGYVGNAGSREIVRKPSSTSLGGYAPPPSLPEMRRRNSPDLPVVHFRNRNIQGSGSLKRNEAGDNEVESNPNTLTQSQILGATCPDPLDVGNTGSDPLPSSPNSHCQTPSTERSSVASIVSVKHMADPLFFGGRNTPSDTLLPQTWVTSPLAKDNIQDSAVSGSVLPAIDELMENKSRSGSYSRDPGIHRKLSVEQLADVTRMMRVFENDCSNPAQKPISKSRSGPELCRHRGTTYSQPLTIQNKGYRPHVAPAPFLFGIHNHNNNGYPERGVQDSERSPFQPPAKVSSANVKSAPRISLKMDHATPDGSRAYYRCPTSSGRANFDADMDDVSPPPLPPPPSDEALYGSRFCNPGIRIPNPYNPESESRSAFRPVVNKLSDNKVQNCPLVVFNPSSPILPQTNGIADDALPVGKFPNSLSRDRHSEGDEQQMKTKNLPVKLLIPNRSESFRPINQKQAAPPYQIKRRQPFRIPSRICRSLDHIPSDIDDSQSSSSRTGSPKNTRQPPSGTTALSALIRNSLLPDNISLSSMGSSEVSHSDSNLNYDSGSTAYESEYDNYRPGMGSDEDYFVPEPISDVDIDMFDDVDNVQVRENYDMDMSLINKMITDV